MGKQPSEEDGRLNCPFKNSTHLPGLAIAKSGAFSLEHTQENAQKNADSVHAGRAGGIKRVLIPCHVGIRQEAAKILIFYTWTRRKSVGPPGRHLYKSKLLTDFLVRSRANFLPRPQYAKAIKMFLKGLSDLLINEIHEL